MSSSDDDVPLVAQRKPKNIPNGVNGGITISSPSKNISTQTPFISCTRAADSLPSLAHAPLLSENKISKSVDAAMDKALPSNGEVKPGISLMNGPVMEVDTEMKDADGDVNGSGPSKRKSRGSLARPSYAEPESSEDDDQPLVRFLPPSCCRRLTPTPEQEAPDIHKARNRR